MTFRLLDLHSCGVIGYPITSYPPYVAISHAWTEQLFPTGHAFLDSPGRKSVLAAVGQRCPTINYCWIDTICIDQADDSDKQRQIPLMGQIFENAEAVLIILNCDLGMRQDLIDQAQQELEGAIYMYEQETWREDGHYWRTGHGRGLIVKAMQGLTKLTTTAWTTRVWTLQEYILARSVVWIGTDPISLVLKDILFSALPYICDTLAIDECLDEKFQKLYSFCSGMANCRLKTLDRTRVMELLGNRRASVPCDEVYGVMAASGVVIQPIVNEDKELAWSRWLEAAVSQGHIRWLLLPKVSDPSRNCIFPPFNKRYIASSASRLDTVQALGPAMIKNGTVTVSGRLVGSCVLRHKLGSVHAPTADRIHRDITLIVFGRGTWLRAVKVATAFGAGRYNRWRILLIAQALVANWPKALRAIQSHTEDEFRVKTIGVRQTLAWQDFMELQMNQMPGMDDGVAYLANIRRSNVSLDVVVTLDIDQDVSPGDLKAIDLGGRTIDERCVFLIATETSIAVKNKERLLHKVAVTLPVTGDFEDAITQLPLERFSIGGQACHFCTQLRPTELTDQVLRPKHPVDDISAPSNSRLSLSFGVRKSRRPYGTWSRARTIKKIDKGSSRVLPTPRSKLGFRQSKG